MFPKTWSKVMTTTTTTTRTILKSSIEKCEDVVVVEIEDVYVVTEK